MIRPWRFTFESASICLIILVVGIAAVLPMLSDCRLSAHDFDFHRINSYYFAAQLFAGEFYPRWLSDMNAGFGSPVMFFYGPVPYYFSALLKPLTGSSLASCQDLAFSCALASVASGACAYIWLRTVVSTRAALVGAIVYMLAPYHLSTDLYGRFALAEYWAFVWLPLAMYCARRMADDSFAAVIGLGLSLGLTALTHLPTLVIFLPLPIIYAASQGRKSVSWLTMCRRLVIAILICIGLSGIYLIPALTTQHWVSMSSMIGGYFDFRANFLFEGPSRTRAFQRVMERSALLAMLASSSALLIVMLFERRSLRREAIMLYGAAVLSFIMMLSASKPIWIWLPVLQRIQFPWRFQILLVVATAGLIAIALDSITRRAQTPFAQAWPDQARSITFLISVLILVLSQLSVLNGKPLDGKDLLVFSFVRIGAMLALFVVLLTNMGLPLSKLGIRLLVMVFWMATFFYLGSQDYISIFRSRSESMKKESILVGKSAPEHWPKWVPKYRYQAAHLSRWSNGTPRLRVTRGSARLVVMRWGSRAITFQSQSREPVVLELKRFYYPIWKMMLNGRPVSGPPRPTAEGLMEVTIPAGDQTVGLVMEPILAEKIGALMFALTVGVCGLLFMLLKFGTPPRVR